MKTDFENIREGSRVRLIPNANNPLHSHPVIALFSGGYYFCDGTDPREGPDYYFRDVGLYNSGYEALS